MLKKRNQLRSILGQICYQNRNRNRNRNQNQNQNLMSCAIRSDPICKGFHSNVTNNSSNINIIDNNSNGFLRFKGKVNSGSLILRGCFDSTNGVKAGADQKVGAFAPPQRVPHLEIAAAEGCTDARLVNGSGSSERGNPIGFFDGRLRGKFVVAVDVDEVLGNFVSALNRFIADRYSLNHSVSEYHVYEFFKIWNCSRDEDVFSVEAGKKQVDKLYVRSFADLRVHEFFKTPYFKTGIHPLPGAQKALHKLSRYCSLSVVTSRQHVIKDHTIEWIERHYPGLFQEIHFGNHFALAGESRPKSEICRSLGAKVLIDDNPRYAIECAEVGIKVLLFDYENSYPWCKTDSVHQHPLVTKVHNWEEVEQQLVSWIVM